MPVAEITETAFLTAHFRALESSRPDAHFRDLYARELAGERGLCLASCIPALDATVSGCVVRTSLMDESILRQLQCRELGAVLNLGCGLDTRPYRLALPDKVHWIDVDLPSVIAHKTCVLARSTPRCRLESVALDLTDRGARHDLFHHAAALADRILIVTEGLLGYLAPEEVAELATDLYRHIQFDSWICELASPMALAMIVRGLPGERPDKGPSLRFAPADGPAYFSRFGWGCVDYQSFFEAGRRMRRWIVPEALVTLLNEDQRRALDTLVGLLTLSRIPTADKESRGPKRPESS